MLAVCGSEEMPGAAVLVARAALRAGAGLVTVACRSSNLMSALPVAVPEAVLLDLRDVKHPAVRMINRADHVRLVGPGLGSGKEVRMLLDELLATGFEGAWVVDADALNVLEGDLEALQRRSGPLVLTPHPGEAARLLRREIPTDAAGRIAAAREMAVRANAVCVLKGRGTVVAEGARAHVNDTGNAGMATAGSGDVLAGILAAYLAPCVTGLDPSWTAFDAAACAVRVHGRAGALAAEALGERAVTASDLVRHLPEAQRALD